MDGVPIYSNSNEMSFFRHNSFWYLGRLTTWPRESHYRCVEKCPSGTSVPPLSAKSLWKTNYAYGKDPAPIITLEPCSNNINNEL